MHLTLVVSFVPLKLLDDPEAAVWLIFVRHLHEFLAERVIKLSSSVICLAISPVQNFLVNGLALTKGAIKFRKIGIRLAC